MIRMVRDEFYQNMTTTIGYAFMKTVLTIDGIPVHLEIYDTGE